MTDKLKITIPATTLNVVEKGETRQFGFKDLVFWFLNNDARFNQDGLGIRSSIRIERALEGDSTELTIKPEDQSRLAEALLSPSGRAYPINPARILEPWIAAVEKAQAVEE